MPNFYQIDTVQELCVHTIAYDDDKRVTSLSIYQIVEYVDNTTFLHHDQSLVVPLVRQTSDTLWQLDLNGLGFK